MCKKIEENVFCLLVETAIFMPCKLGVVARYSIIAWCTKNSNLLSVFYVNKAVFNNLPLLQ